MPSLAQFAPSVTNDATQKPTQARGTVVRTVPTTASDPLFVTLNRYTTTYPFEVPPGNWRPNGATMPVAGTACLVIFDDHGDPWVPIIQ